MYIKAFQRGALGSDGVGDFVDCYNLTIEIIMV